MAHNYDVGTQAWQPDVAEGWIASEVIEKRIEGDRVTLIFQLEDGEVRRRPILLPRRILTIASLFRLAQFKRHLLHYSRIISKPCLR